MPATISVIGLGQLGTAFVSALSKYNDQITVQAYDPDRGKFARLMELGILKTSEMNLPSVVNNATLLVDCSPYSAVKQNLAYYAGNLPAGSIYLCCAPNKQKLSAEFESEEKSKISFVGLAMTFNLEKQRTILPKKIFSDKDLFENASIGVSFSKGADETVVRKAFDLIALLGAKGILMDHHEADLTEDRVYINPLLQAAVTLTAASETGWLEASQFSGYAFTQLAAISGVESTNDLAEILLDRPEGALRWLSASRDSAKELEKSISSGDKSSLLDHFISLEKTRTEFLKRYGTGGVQTLNQNRISESFIQKIMGVFSRRNG